MQILNDKSVATKTPELTELFWKQMEEGLEPLAKKLFTKQLRDYDFETTRTQELHRQTFQKIREKIGPDAILYFSQPSRLMYRFLATLIGVSEVAKREAKASGAEWLGEYDMEADIRETRPQAEHHLQSFFEMELAYWKAMEEERYADAKTILNAMTVMRRSKELIYQIECINWKLDLAGCTGDTELFLDAIASLPDDPESALNEDGVKENLKRVLFTSGMCEIRVGLSPEGQRWIAREASPVEFLRGQTDVFTASLLAQITTAMLLNKRMSVTEFTKLVETATEECRTSFLKVHPFITDLIVVWKKRQ